MMTWCNFSVGDLVKKFCDDKVGIVIKLEPHEFYISKDGCNDWVTFVYPEDWIERRAMAYELDLISVPEKNT